MPRHPSKTTLIVGPSSIGKTYAVREFARTIADQITLLGTSPEPGYQPFSIEAVRAATTPFLAIDEVADVGHFNPQVFAEALRAMEQSGLVRHLILVAWSDRAAREEGFVFPRGTKVLPMRELRMSLILEGEAFRFQSESSRAA